MRLTTAEAKALSLDESKIDASTVGAIGRRTSDVPRNQWAIWNNYKFTAGKLRGIEASLGFTFKGSRQGGQVIDNGLRDRSVDENRRYRPQIPLEKNQHRDRPSWRTRRAQMEPPPLREQSPRPAKAHEQQYQHALR